VRTGLCLSFRVYFLCYELRNTQSYAHMYLHCFLLVILSPTPTPTHSLTVKTALHDIWVLSMTDDAILSRSSTFGYHSMALKGKPLLFPVSSKGAECRNVFRNITNLKCFRSFSAEPCFDRSIFFGTHMRDLLAESIIVRCEEGCGFMGPGETNPRGWKLNVLS
jgi:Xyloglucan fucosyltransferase